MRCPQPGCGGEIEDGYCNVCGLAAPRTAMPAVATAVAGIAISPSADGKCRQPGCGGEIEDGFCNVCGLAPPRNAATAATSAAGAGTTAASPTARTTSSTTRRRTTTRSTSSRARIGAGLVDIAPIPVRDPATVVLADPQVAEEKRYCSQCGEPVGRGREGVPGRTEGFCRQCGHPFSFTPKLKPGEVVAGQYEVVGCLAHGGLGWIYLARDRHVSDRWVVLKGLLNTNDREALAAAMAERRFLAEVEHPNIVKIYNFVEHLDDGYIVMEYVDGVSLRHMLEIRRRENEGQPDPLPLAHAIAYTLEILPAFGYLHRLGLLYCDFKPDNVIQTASSLKLIDLGGVYRINDESSPIYGTAGYQAPEIAETGPTIPSDLFTIGRSLAVLCTNFRGYQSTYEFTLPAPDEIPVYQTFGSLYQFLLRATATNPDDRFQSAEEMADQLLGVLREVVAAESGAPKPGTSTNFSRELVGVADEVDWKRLPAPLATTDDPAAGFLAMVAGTEPAELVGLLDDAPERTIEVELRLASALVDLGRYSEAEELLATLERDDPWEWRIPWHRGLCALAQGRGPEALGSFRAVYWMLPGELAVKLALGYAAELAGDDATAAHWYDLVSRTDPAFTSAAFGLARCRLRLGERAAGITAFARIPDTSHAYIEAQMARARAVLDGQVDGNLDLDEIASLAASIGALPLHAEQRSTIVAAALEAALQVVTEGDGMGSASTAFGYALQEESIRRGLEQSYRELARHAAVPSERCALVDRANQVRAWTLV